MNITRSFFHVVIVCILASVFSLKVYAQGSGDLPLDRLNLTEAQLTQVKQLKESFKSETEPIRAAIKKLLDEEKQLKSANPPNEAALRQKMKQRADKEIELSLALNRFKQNLEAILSPAQRELLKKLRQESNK